MGFFERIADMLRGLRGGQPEQQAAQPEPELFRGKQAEYSGQSFYEAQNECETGYYQSTTTVDRRGRTHATIPRYYAINPTIDCVRGLIRDIGYRDFYAMSVHGEPCSSYPGQESQEETHITYAISGNTLRGILEGSADILELLDEINALEPLIEVSGECEHAWDSVSEINFLDR